MRTEAIVQALLEIWAELPSLVGPDWPMLYPQIEAILESLQNRKTDAQRGRDAADLILAFRKYPAARLRLRKTIDELESLPGWKPKTVDRSGETDLRNIAREPGKEPPIWSEMAPSLRNRIDPPTVTRYSDVTAPRTLPVGQRRAVAVGLSRTPKLASAEACSLAVDPSALVEVHLHTSSGIEIEGKAFRSLAVHPEEDTEPVAFFIQGIEPGDHRLVLDFRQGGLHVGSLRLAIEVVEDEVPEQEQRAEGALLLGGPYIPPVDLEIRVTVEIQAGRTSLAYVLHAPGAAAGFHYQSFRGPSLIGSPEDYSRTFLEKIHKLGARKDPDDQPLSREQVASRLAGLGRQLYAELFPPEMRAAYRRFRNVVKTLQITSDEPWFPWEIVKPYDDSDPADVIDDDFLCARFQMTRWLAGQSCPQGRVRVQRLACIEAGAVPDREPLPFAAEEKKYVESLGVPSASPSLADLATVEALLDAGGIDLWHFTAHGDVDPRYPDDAVLILADGRKLRAGDLHGPRQTRIARDRPLVFLNACRVGQQGFSLARLGGWAAAWVERSRCGTFIGPLWSVHDQIAFEFVRGFYEALKKKKTIGQALEAARQRARDLDAEIPTWLAYSVYAHPNARVVLEPMT